MMKIQVNRIPEEGLREHATYDPSKLDMERQDIRLADPIEVDAVVNKTDDELLVEVDIECSMRMECARCLEQFETVLRTDALFNYEVKPSDIIDITDDVRQEIILGYPMIPVCRSDCRGLCRICGQNLNQGGCAHQGAAPAEE
jgi:uncharacterized protein